MGGLLIFKHQPLDRYKFEVDFYQLTFIYNERLTTAMKK